ncbi:pentapeptide repeat-containing protein [Mycoavidus sp. HKI]|uniref:WD40 repeat domain-containing protein n=1 Tax=Mycoavidus sp. HKI TaxID=2840467 RepID=UPI001CBAF365|nr:WD40 repeat domain-containing protein [Mycoavidus sp. HKI]UAW63521.1 pentapeptide repeat-containing protein [Mycoavidus sp. HKI]
MLTSISNSAITHYPAAQKTVKPSFLLLTLEIREAIENLLDFSSQQDLFKALTTVTRNSEPIDSPVLKLHLIKDRIQAKYQEALIHSDKSLEDFAWNEVARLCVLHQLDQAVEKSALLELLWFVNDLGLFGYIYDEIDSEIEQKLLSWVERSKTEEVQTVAANALMLLVKAGVQLKNRDFRGIRVPGADLSHGVFDDTQFQGADLRNVNWYHAQLRRVNLEGADLQGLELVESPALQMENEVKACCYSLDGHWLAVKESQYIYLYETESLQKVHTYTSHRYSDSSIAFSRDGQWLAAGDGNLWHVLGDRSLAHTYSGFGSVAFSVDGQYLAVVNYDNSVQLWHVSGDRSLARAYTGYYGHLGLHSVVFSSDGQWLAASDTRTALLWHVSGDGSPVHRYTEDWVGDPAFSVDGQYVAFGSAEGVNLWHVSDNLSLVHTYTGHNERVSSVAFSNDGQWLASADLINTVKLWYVSGSRSLACTYTGHTSRVNSIAFSSDSQWLASASDDKTVGLWHIRRSAYIVSGRELEEGTLTAEDALIENACGLSSENAALLRQRGAR